MHTFWGGHEVDWIAITALATIALVIATLILAWVAWYQIAAARDEAKLNRTLIACDRYDLDPVLDGAARRLAVARDSGDLQRNPRVYRIDIYSVLNYLESIAIGIDEGLYDEELVRKYMEPICQGSIEEYITSGLIKPLGLQPADFSRTLALCEKWS